MSVILLILPDFLLIGLGWMLLHKWRFTPEFFRELEKLVYFVLFPALLFHSITRSPISLHEAYELLKATAALTAGGIVLAWLAKPRSEEHTSELQSRGHLVCCLLLVEKLNT